MVTNTGNKSLMNHFLFILKKYCDSSSQICRRGNTMGVLSNVGAQHWRTNCNYKHCLSLKKRKSLHRVCVDWNKNTYIFANRMYMPIPKVLYLLPVMWYAYFQPSALVWHLSITFYQCLLSPLLRQTSPITRRGLPRLRSVSILKNRIFFT